MVLAKPKLKKYKIKKLYSFWQTCTYIFHTAHFILSIEFKINYKCLDMKSVFRSDLRGCVASRDVHNRFHVIRRGKRWADQS